jgi:hypothetical protein
MLLVLFGCAERSEVVSLGPPKARVTHESYDKLRERWTRQQKVIKKLDTTLRVHATCFSPEFVAVYTVKRAQIFKLPPGEREALSRQLKEEWSRSYPFLVAMATQDYSWNDLDRKNSVWKVTLANDKKQVVSPSQITAEREVTPTITELFPFVSRFHRVYHLRFPKTLPDGSPLVGADTEQLALRLAGALGHAELTWRLR